MNLYYHYPHIYWQCAVLTVNASANEDDDSKSSTNYGKIATAISDMIHKGVKVSLPDINKAKFGFSPDQETNSIVFGLKAISGVGDDDATQIIQNRPYSSLQDFCSKNPDLTKTTMIALIKAGAFDVIEKKSRYDVMKEYVFSLAQSKNPSKSKLTMANFKNLINMNLVPDSFTFEKRLFLFKQYAFNKMFMVTKDFYICDTTSRIFFDTVLYKFLTEDVEYCYREDNLFLNQKAFDKWYKNAMKPISEWIASDAIIDRYNRAVIADYANKIWGQYCLGTIPHWEMDALSFYDTAHELAPVNLGYYDISNFFELPEEPVVVGTSERKAKDGTVTTWDKYQLFRIAGTVLDKNKTRHSVSLLTPNGVVNVKLHAEAFAFYDKQISSVNENGEKYVKEKSWFNRGNIIIVTGIRRGDTFQPKKYSDSVYQHTVCLVQSIGQDGSMIIQQERAR